MKFLILLACLVSIASAYTSFMSFGGQTLISNGRQTYGGAAGKAAKLSPSLNVVSLKPKSKPLPALKPLKALPKPALKPFTFNRPLLAAVASVKPKPKRSYVPPPIVQEPEVVEAPQVIEQVVEPVQVEQSQAAVLSAAPAQLVTLPAPKAAFASPRLVPVQATQYVGLAAPQVIDAPAPVEQVALAAPKYVSAQPAVQYSEVQPGGTITAAVQTRYSVQFYDVPSTGDRPQSQQIIIPANAQPIEIAFHSQSSPINVRQVHIPGRAAPPQFSSHQDEPDVVKQEIIKPIIQEVREAIQPLRKVTQEVRPVVEQINQILTRGRTVQTIAAKPSATLAAVAPTIFAKPIAAAPIAPAPIAPAPIAPASIAAQISVESAPAAVAPAQAALAPATRAPVPIFIAINKPDLIAPKATLSAVASKPLTTVTPLSKPLAIDTEVVEEPFLQSVFRTVEVAQEVQEIIDKKKKA